ncbi:1812_t:CDS:2 [Entrophospora sp. SA101]|nr:1812_t:CDS:2 [Entrophospora sp. SA101]
MLSGTFWIFTFKGSADGSQLAAQETLRTVKERWSDWSQFCKSTGDICLILFKASISEKEEYDGENDYGGALFVLKKLLDEWENPPKPALTPEQEEKLKNYDELKKENEKLRNRELTDNEKKIMSEFRRTFPNTGTINARLRTVRRMLNNLERNDLSVEANPNLSAEKISFSQRLAESFEQFTLVCELYLGTERDFSKKLKELRDEIHRLEDKIDELEGERQ